jgi:hypothetical protein
VQFTRPRREGLGLPEQLRGISNGVDVARVRDLVFGCNHGSKSFDLGQICRLTKHIGTLVWARRFATAVRDAKCIRPRNRSVHRQHTGRIAEPSVIVSKFAERCSGRQQRGRYPAKTF